MCMYVWPFVNHAVVTASPTIITYTSKIQTDWMYGLLCLAGRVLVC